MTQPPHADLTGWTCAPVTGAGQTHDVYRRGDGPGVVLIPEMPGLTPEVLGLGNHLVDEGFTVAAPSLFGVPGRANGAQDVAVMARGGVAREFAAFATTADRPVAHFLRALARDLTAVLTDAELRAKLSDGALRHAATLTWPAAAVGAFAPLALDAIRRRRRRRRR